MSRLFELYDTTVDRAEFVRTHPEARRGDVFLHSRKGVPHVSALLHAPAAGLSWKLEACFVPLDETIRFADAYAHYAALIGYFESQNNRLERLVIDFAPTDPGLAGNVGSFDARYHRVRVTWMAARNSAHKCRIVEIFPEQHVVVPVVNRLLRSTERLSPDACKVALARYTATEYWYLVLCSVPFQLPPTPGLPAFGFGAAEQQTRDAQSTRFVEPVTIGSVSIPPIGERPGALVYGRWFQSTPQRVADTIAYLRLHYTRVLIVPALPDRRYVRTDAGELRVEWREHAECGRPHQQDTIVGIATILLRLVPVYVLLEIIDNLPWMQYWSRFDKVRELERVQKSMRKVLDAKQSLADAKCVALE